MIGYHDIKAMAKTLARPVTDLLALARHNDPFYAGTPADLTQAKWFAQVWEAGGFREGAHLRRLHYWCVSQAGLTQHDGKPYANTEACWQYLCQASKKARYLGLVDIADIADHKNPEPTIYAHYGFGGPISVSVHAPELARPDIFVDGFVPSRVQPYHLEVWVEKSTMNDVLLPVCQAFRANLVTGEGEMSITAVHDFVRRVRTAQRPARLFYISDFDPAGHSMPKAVARKIEWLLQRTRTDLSVKLRPLALTLDQVRDYALPRTPIKESERRGAIFEERYGEGAVELDALEALHPGTLANLVRDALRPYYSVEAERELYRKQSALRQAVHAHVEAIVNRYRAQIAALEAMRRELEAIEIPDLKDYTPQRAEAAVDDADVPWLYDSQRSYLEQIAMYQRYRNGHAVDDDGEGL